MFSKEIKYLWYVGKFVMAFAGQMQMYCFRMRWFQNISIYFLSIIVLKFPKNAITIMHLA